MATDQFWLGKRVLITGHTGFKGAWLAHVLLAKGAKITGVALAPSTKPSLFDATKLNHKLDHHECDIRDFNSLKAIINKTQPEIVFHLAAQALVRPSYADPIGTYATNVMGTVHVLDSIRQTTGVKVVINVTSDKCYENREWEWGYRETDPMGGFDPYSSSKGCAELVASAYRRSYFQNHELRLASVRAGNVIGGGDWATDRLVPDAMKAFASGTSVTIRMPGSTRPWQHVLEPLYGYMLVAEKSWSQPAVADGWNFGPNDEDAKPVRYVIDRLVKLWGDGAKWIDESDERKHLHEARYLKLDCSKAKTRLGWTPVLQIDQALQLTVEWYREFYRGGSAQDLCLRQIQFFEEVMRSKMKEGIS